MIEKLQRTERLTPFFTSDEVIDKLDEIIEAVNNLEEHQKRQDDAIKAIARNIGRVNVEELVNEILSTQDTSL